MSIFGNSLTASIRTRRDIRENWEKANPILGLGEFSLVLDEYPTPIRIGDGSTRWKDLPEQYFDASDKGFKYMGVATPDTVPSSTYGYWIAAKEGDYVGFSNIHVPLGKVFIFVYVDESWIPLDSGIFSSEGADHLKKSYLNPPIIGENGNWYLWDPKKARFVDSHIPAQGRPGQKGESAGFGEITAEVHFVSSEEAATVTVQSSGPDSAKNFHFIFNLPQTYTYITLTADDGTKELKFTSAEETLNINVQSNTSWYLKVID